MNTRENVIVAVSEDDARVFGSIRRLVESEDFSHLKYNTLVRHVKKNQTTNVRAKNLTGSLCVYQIRRVQVNR